ncbi:MAG: family 10 glycosylhydrolase [Chloroflexota bacterium]|nr:family 10 glycosylhydrolase [Chloroflexota bacterium]
MGEHAARLSPGPTDDAQWYYDTFRTLCLDFHYPEWVTDLGAALDEHTASAQMEELAAIGVEAVHVVAKDRYGHALYPTDVPGGERHPHLASDYLGTTVRAARQVGLRAVAYFNVGASEALHARQPDWRMRLLDGADDSPTDGPLCLLSPYRSEIVLPQLTEIARTYAVDGFWLDGLGWQLSRWCGCRWCQAAFGQATGHDAIPAPAEPHADSYRQWRAATQEEIAAEITALLHAIEPRLIVVSAGATPGSYGLPAAGRPGGRWRGQAGGWRRFDPLAVSSAGRLLTAQRQPTAAAIARVPGAPGSWSLPSTAALNMACATALAVGGRSLLAAQPYPDGQHEPSVIEALADTCEFIIEREDWCRDAVVVPLVAILHSTATLRYTDHQRGGGSLASVRAAHKMLVESGWHALIVDEATLEQRIDEFATIVLPEQAVLPETTVAALRDFVRRGGGLVAAGSVAAWDERGQPRPAPGLDDVLGVRRADDERRLVGYLRLGSAFLAGTEIRDMALPVAGRWQAVRPAGAQPLARHLGLHPAVAAPAGEPQGRADRAGWSPPGGEYRNPGINLHHICAGSAVYIAGPIFSAYSRHTAPDLRRVVARCLDLATPLTQRVVALHGPPSVELSLFRQRIDHAEEPTERAVQPVRAATLPPERAGWAAGALAAAGDAAPPGPGILGGPADRGRWRYIAHLVNYHAERPLRPVGPPVTEWVPEVRDIQVSLRADEPPRVVRQEPEGSAPSWVCENGRLVVTVPRLHIHSCIVVEW